MRVFCATVMASAGLVVAAPSHAADFAFQYLTGLRSDGFIVPQNHQVAFDGQSIAYIAEDEQVFFSGIYRMPLGGAPQLVVRANTPAPGGGMFGSLTDPPSISNGSIAFHAGTTEGRGVFTNAGGSVEAVIGPGFDDLPDGGRDVRWGRRPPISDGTVLFNPSDTSNSTYGVFAWSAATGGRTVVDHLTPNPVTPGQPFSPFGANPAISDGYVGILSLGNPGVFLYDANGNHLQTIATNLTPAPGGTGNFTQFGTAPMDTDHGAVLFESGSGPGSIRGLYTTLGGTLRLVANTLTPIPGGTGRFTAFTSSSTEFAVSPAGVVFAGFGSGGQEAIYGDFGEGLERIIGAGDMLDGRQVLFAGVGRDGLVGNRMVFLAQFTDGQSSIYIVTVPAPSAALAAGTALGLVWRRRARPRASILATRQSGTH